MTETVIFNYWQRSQSHFKSNDRRRLIVFARARVSCMKMSKRWPLCSSDARKICKSMSRQDIFEESQQTLINIKIELLFLAIVNFFVNFHFEADDVAKCHRKKCAHCRTDDGLTFRKLVFGIQRRRSPFSLAAANKTRSGTVEHNAQLSSITRCLIIMIWCRIVGRVVTKGFPSAIEIDFNVHLQLFASQRFNWSTQ